MESAEGKIGNAVEQLYLYCFHYNPATGKYGLEILSVMRLMAVATVLGLGGMLFVFWRREKNKSGVLK
jgi:protein SCO1/2